MAERGLDNLVDDNGVVHAGTRPHTIYNAALCGSFWREAIDANVTCIECIAREGEGTLLGNVAWPWDGTRPVIS